MDKNQDGTVSQQEFMSWWAEIATAKRATTRRFREMQDSVFSNTAAAGGAAATTAAAAATAGGVTAWSSGGGGSSGGGRGAATLAGAAAGAAAMTAGEVAGTPAMSLRQLGLIGVVSGIPMVGFGFVDNLLMILAGDAIDMSIGLTFGLSALAAAALGNAFSDVVGVCVPVCVCMRVCVCA